METLGDLFDQTILRQHASAVQGKNAMRPYSNFSRWGALRTASGRFLSGCNVETCLPEGHLIAERAIAAMIAAGETCLCRGYVIAGSPCPSRPAAALPSETAEFGQGEAARDHGDGFWRLKRLIDDAELLPGALAAPIMER